MFTRVCELKRSWLTWLAFSNLCLCLVQIIHFYLQFIEGKTKSYIYCNNCMMSILFLSFHAEVILKATLISTKGRNFASHLYIFKTYLYLWIKSSLNQDMGFQRTCTFIWIISPAGVAFLQYLNEVISPGALREDKHNRLTGLMVKYTYSLFKQLLGV